jgi:hypothetical protein
VNEEIEDVFNFFVSAAKFGHVVRIGIPDTAADSGLVLASYVIENVEH